MKPPLRGWFLHRSITGRLRRALPAPSPQRCCWVPCLPRHPAADTARPRAHLGGRSWGLSQGHPSLGPAGAAQGPPRGHSSRRPGRGSCPPACRGAPSTPFPARSRCCLEGTSRKSSAQSGSEHKEVTRSSGCWPKAGLKMMSPQSTPTCHIYCNINVLNGNGAGHMLSSWVIAEIGVRILAAQRLTLRKAGDAAPRRRSLSITCFQSLPAAARCRVELLPTYCISITLSGTRHRLSAINF